MEREMEPERKGEGAETAAALLLRHLLWEWEGERRAVNGVGDE